MITVCCWVAGYLWRGFGEGVLFVVVLGIIWWFGFVV